MVTIILNIERKKTHDGKGNDQRIAPSKSSAISSRRSNERITVKVLSKKSEGSKSYVENTGENGTMKEYEK